MSDIPATSLLTIALPSDWVSRLQGEVGEERIHERDGDIDRLLEESFDPAPAVVVCGPAAEGINPADVVIALRTRYPETPIFFVTPSRPEFNRTELRKNGFTDAFLLPFEGLVFEMTVKAHLAEASDGRVRAYRPVKLVDLGPEAIPDFDTFLFLPANEKYVRFAVAGESLDGERLERLAKHEVGSLFITQENAQKFYRFTAQRLRAICATDGETPLSETERREKAHAAVRDLLGEMFRDDKEAATAEQGQAILEDCREIVRAFVATQEKSERLPWFDRLSQAASGSKGFHCRAVNVSTLAALFALGTGTADPTDVAIAGILHDIGLVDVDATIQAKAPSERTSDERQAYERHPELGMDLIKARKLNISDAIIEIVLQHHERYDGTGFPKRLAKKEISLGAQVLAIADWFDEMTGISSGIPRVTPLQALRLLNEMRAGGVGSGAFDPELIEAIVALFVA